MDTLAKEDLARSGLSKETIEAIRVRDVAPEMLSRIGMHHKGYLIPYFDVDGELLSPLHYRIKLLTELVINGKKAKYIQPKGSQSHAYLPPLPGLSKRWKDSAHPIVITEGEKKAAKACQEGILCVGLGGIDSWRSRIVKLSYEELVEDVDPDSNSNSLTVKLNSDAFEVMEELVVPEFKDIWWDGREVIICFDSDGREPSYEVQRSAFELAIYLQSEGALVSQVVLPSPDGEKVGLDDFLRAYGPKAFERLKRQPVTHPNLRRWLRRSMDSKRLKRSEIVRQAAAIINQLDAEGQRFVDANTQEYYYYENETKKLHAFRLEKIESQQLYMKSFGQLLETKFGINSADYQLVSRVAAAYTARGIESVTPRRLSYASDNTLYYQLSDSELAKVTADCISIHPNGYDGVLFISGTVDPVDIDKFQELLKAPFKASGLWPEILETVNIQPFNGMSLKESQLLLGCLYYLSPLFRHWRGLMLPVELVISEPNSGKTFLLNLRKAILTGRPALSNPPLSPKDWYSQITHAPGIWICDNMGDGDRVLKELMSDELARLTTDPDPKIEMRRLFTTADVDYRPIDCSFAITAIRIPFWKTDILQRSLEVKMKAVPVGQRDSMWYQRQMQGDGRTKWILDHLLVAQRFLKSVKESWSDTYLSAHRLVHYEQALLHMGIALNREELMREVIRKLFGITQSQIAHADPVLEALIVFSEEVLRKEGPKGKPAPKAVKAMDIIKWCQADKEQRFDHVKALQSPVALGKYVSNHPYDVQEVAGIVAVQRHNQTFYVLKERVDELNDEGAPTE